MSFDDNLELIKRNLQEVIGEETIRECFNKTGTVNLYWGTAPTGKPHIAYFIPMTKLADFLKAGCQVTILFADIHAYLDSVKAPWELLNKRSEYYETLIKGMLAALEVPLDKLRFIRGTDFQLNENYAKAAFEIIGMTSTKAAIKAGCDVVKQSTDPLLSNLIYPLLQALDEEFLGADVQFGGVDQWKIFMFAKKSLPLLSFAKRVHLMNPMIPGITGGKMSASEESSKIDLLETKERMMEKLKGANCEEKTADKNGILALLKCLALPNKNLFDNATLKTYNSCEQIEEDFKNGKLTEKDLKEMVGDILWRLMKDLRQRFKNEKKESLIKEAYPDVPIPPRVEDKDDKNTSPMSKFKEEFKALKELFPEVSATSINQMPAVIFKPIILWSCRVSGEPHIGYFIPLRKLALLSQKNWKVIILIEDIGAYLHSKVYKNKPSLDMFTESAQVYTEMCRKAFEVFGGKFENLEIVVGSEFQLSKKYILSLYQSLSKVTENECRQLRDNLANDQSDTKSSLSSALYPCISVLDQLYFRATVRLFGQYFDNMLSFAKKLSGNLGLEHQMPLYVTHENLVSLDGETIMSSPTIGVKCTAEDKSSIFVYDSEDRIKEKIDMASIDPRNLSKDAIVGIIENIIWPQLKGAPFCIKRAAENGGDVSFKSVEDIKEQLTDDHMHPKDVKNAVVNYLVNGDLELVRGCLSNDCAELIKSTVSEKVKIEKSTFNPNTIDIRVAVVQTIIEKNGSFEITLKTGIDIHIMKTKNMCHLTLNDISLVAMKPSTKDTDSEIIGILTCAKNGSVITLAWKGYVGVVSFENHEFVLPHLKETDKATIIKEIEEHFVVKNEHLESSKDGSLANELKILNKCDGIISIKVGSL